jgi:hypothetical protein
MLNSYPLFPLVVFTVFIESNMLCPNCTIQITYSTRVPVQYVCDQTITVQLKLSSTTLIICGNWGEAAAPVIEKHRKCKLRFITIIIISVRKIGTYIYLYTATNVFTLHIIYKKY